MTPDGADGAAGTATPAGQDGGIGPPAPLGALAERLAGIELFGGLRPEQLNWLAEVGRPLTLNDGDVLFREGDLAQTFFVLLSGRLVVTKLLGGQQQVLSRHSVTGEDFPPEPDKPTAANQFTGELPLLTGTRFVATATAVGATEVVAYSRRTFFTMLERCPQISKVLLPVVAWRIHTHEVQAGRSVMLEGLGTLAAGLAHELNNPTAAVVRGAAELRRLLGALTSWATAWGELATPAERDLLGRAATLLLEGGAGPRPKDALEAADAADRVQDWLYERGLDELDEASTVMADHGVQPESLNRLAGQLRPEVLPAAIGHLSSLLQARTVLEEVTEAGRRVEALVRSTKAYSDLDRAPEREVDLHEGIDATLVILAPFLAGVRVVRDYGELPRVCVHPGELNQVWTNLIENAIDAMGGSGELRITTRPERECVMVEVRDSGPGIADDVLPHLFQPFFTTKSVGEGTGLGLHLSRDIVATRHAGSIEVVSRPGDTRFIVRLPIDRPRLRRASV